MIYSSTSIHEVIARVVRNTRLQDSSYLTDMKEWIPEAMGYMRTKYQMKPTWKDTRISFHKGRLPCGLVTLKAVQYGNYRLKYYDSPRTPDSMGILQDPADSIYPGIAQDGTTAFGSYVVKRTATDEDIPVEFYQANIEPVNLDFHGEHWYFTEMDYLNTSLNETWVRIHYNGIPLDARGLPMIPDEENYKEALYWYCRAKMIGAGYEDKQFTEEICMDRYEKHATRARTKITYPSVDQMEAKMAVLNSLVLPENYWSSFYAPGQENYFNR